MIEVENISKYRIPKHVAVIMDGNGRWAAKRGQERTVGHEQGVQAVKESIKAAASMGIKYLTLYTFSTENWKRPQEEVNFLMGLFILSLKEEIDELEKQNVKLKFIGDLLALPEEVQENAKTYEDRLAKNNGITVIIALSYSARWEIIEATKKIASKVESGELSSNEIQSDLFEQHLTTSEFPDPELLIRTSGEIRLSNFLLWQLAYAELYFTEKLWPDFREADFIEAIATYQKRERRFGKTSEQIEKS